VDKRVNFIRWILGEKEKGWVALGAKSLTGDWRDGIFQIPEQIEEVEQFIRTYEGSYNMYFCPTMLTEPKRIKANVDKSYVLWSDLDDCHPDLTKIKPTVVIETSKDRYQAYWKLQYPVHATDAEAMNRNIAYTHADQGADKSGWDLTQLLRIPSTRNFNHDTPEKVRLVSINTKLEYNLNQFQEDYKQITEFVTQAPDIPFPKFISDRSAEEILDAAKSLLNPNVWNLFGDESVLDRSKSLFQLMMMMFDAGFSLEDIFIVAKDAACNKFKDDITLWKDVVRVSYVHSNRSALFIEAEEPDHETRSKEIVIETHDLLSQQEKTEAEQYKTVIDQYMEWAVTATDAPRQYHVAGAFTVLSCILASTLKLYTEFGEIKPNMWFMIVGDTTTSRKSTAMEMATDFVEAINPEILLATDGTMEGIVTVLAGRPGATSLFHRDEVSGLLQAMSKKDYNAGLLEMFTKLYDGKRMKRLLRKETISVTDPTLVMLTGGTKDGVYGAIDQNHIRSGFMPRYVFVSSNSDVRRLKPLGPRTERNNEVKNGLLTTFDMIYNTYNDIPDNKKKKMKDDIEEEFYLPTSTPVELTSDAWDLYNSYLAKLMAIAEKSTIPELLIPTMARLSMSGLKASMLLAASERLAPDLVTVNVRHIKKAFYYVDSWKTYAFEAVMNAGKSADEKQLDLIASHVIKTGEKGASRSFLMRTYKLNARTADIVFRTLIERNIITLKAGTSGKVYIPVIRRKKLKQLTKV